MEIRNITPNSLGGRLWGRRECWGLTHNDSDLCWRHWQSSYTEFYDENQRVDVDNLVNNAGYIVMSSIDPSDKRLIEIMTGYFRHIKCFQGKSVKYPLGTSQLCRPHPGRTRSGVPPRRFGLLATSTRPQSGHTALLSRASGVICEG